MHDSILACRVRALAGALGAMAAIIVLAAFALAGGASAAQCEGKQVTPSQDLDQVVNSDPADAATTFCVQGYANGTPATYNLSHTLNLRNGDKLIGPRVPLVQRGPASYPGTPLVNLRNGNDLSRLVNMQGSNVVVKWVDVAGAETLHTADGSPVNGTGIGIGASQADATSRIQYVVCHDNLAMGINGTTTAATGFGGASAPRRPRPPSRASGALTTSTTTRPTVFGPTMTCTILPSRGFVAGTCTTTWWSTTAGGESATSTRPYFRRASTARKVPRPRTLTCWSSITVLQATAMVRSSSKRHSKAFGGTTPWAHRPSRG
jgi:hypothetical protein